MRKAEIKAKPSLRRLTEEYTFSGWLSPPHGSLAVTQLYLPIWSPSLSFSVQQIGSRKKEEALGSHLHIRALFPLFLLRTGSPPTLLI